MNGNGRQVVLGIVIAMVAVVSYFANTETNAITGHKQHVELSPSQEIALGVQATPDMTRQYGGESGGSDLALYVEQVGRRVVQRSEAAGTPYQFRFHCLNDESTVNAFALPGGQVFITRGLLLRLTDEAQLAGCLGHEIGHVVARHGAEHLAQQRLTQGLVSGVAIASQDGRHPGRSAAAAALATAVSHLVNLKYGRNDELEADSLGVRFMHEAGYDTRGMAELMNVLVELSSGSRQPEFFSTHPNPGNRLERIEKLIAEGGSGGDLGRERFQKHLTAARH